MKKIYNNIIPLKGYKAITLWPWVFIRKSAMYDDITDRHKEIHGHQQKEMLIVGLFLALWLFVFGCGWWSLLAVPIFFWWYVIEWLMKWVYYKNSATAYRNIGFEREAYTHQRELDYEFKRELFAWRKLIKV